MTGDEAMSLVQAKKDRRLNTEACMRFARTLSGGGGSLADLDDAMWLSEVVDEACDNATVSRDYEIAALMREIDVLKDRIDDMRHDAMERGER